jgi:hypothetical protein
MNGIAVLGLIAATLVANWLIEWSIEFRQRSVDGLRRQKAEEFLRLRGMEAYTYLPSIACEPGELRDALSAFDHRNLVVLDHEGRLVGRLLPKVQATGPGLRLVVDNTK